MTDIFHYDNLTWPEVAELPRDVPLVLPLGSSFDSEKVAAQLGNPQRLGILPSFRFGWRGGEPSMNEKRINEYGAPSRRRCLQE
jgi:hypothetical protein